MKLRIGDRSWDLLCAGQPDCIGADGQVIGWATGNLLCRWNPEEETVQGLVLPADVEMLTLSADLWTIATDVGFFRVNPLEMETVDALLLEPDHPTGRWVGRDVALLRGPSLYRLEDQKPLPLPRTMATRTLRPWTRGLGWCWMDGEVVGRNLEQLGTIPQCEWIEAGPDGALVAAGPQQLGIALPKRPLQTMNLPSIRPPVCFSRDRTRILLRQENTSNGDEVSTNLPDSIRDTEPETVRFSGGSGEDRLAVTLVRDGFPVGFLQDHPVLLRNGTLHWTQQVPGWASVPASRVGDRLLGPGGILWDLTTGTALLHGFSGIVATDGEQIWQVDQQRFGKDGGPRFPHHLVENTGDRLAWARWEAGLLHLGSLDGETGSWNAETGERQMRRRDAPNFRKTKNRNWADFPLMVVDSHSAGERSYAWTGAGMLLATPQIR